MSFWEWQNAEPIAALATFADAALTFIGLHSGKFREGGLARFLFARKFPWSPAALMLVAHFGVRWSLLYMGAGPKEMGYSWSALAVIYAAAAIWDLRKLGKE